MCPKAHAQAKLVSFLFHEEMPKSSRKARFDRVTVWVKKRVLIGVTVWVSVEKVARSPSQDLRHRISVTRSPSQDLRHRIGMFVVLGEDTGSGRSMGGTQLG